MDIEDLAPLRVLAFVPAEETRGPGFAGPLVVQEKASWRKLLRTSVSLPS